MVADRPLLLVARREATLVVRSRAARVSLLVLTAIAWIPVLLVPLRAGTLGIASFATATPLTLALGGVVLPLLALLAGADLLAGEMEDGTLGPVLTLPISRRVFFFGKAFARGGLLCGSYLAAYGSAGLALAIHGTQGGGDFVAVAGSGLLLCLACGGIGALIGAYAAGRVRAYGYALLTWVAAALVVDVILLATLVALAPAPPAAVGMHGHDEMRAPTPHSNASDPHARSGGDVEMPADAPFTWLLGLNPVDLYRLTAVAAGPGLQARVRLGLPEAGGSALSVPLGLAWAGWLVLPSLLALGRFRRTPVR